ncbi:MAG: hypothetical protein JNK30_11735 [Phenylobacterium sp.]|uniref:hypothetical protein n=1 Tax=Phenylobacterium sp. TaxID=1871053 RepID=UPI001A3EB4D7|nr:hypothetical protein [Phenylobacterium sp.]MBL8772042.1 hypothetical protein [Phenylobacterium sp.]
MPSEADKARPDPGRLVIEIEAWERWQHLGPWPSRAPRKYSFQGGLSYSPSFDIRGRALDHSRGERARIWISPTPNLKIGPGALLDVGQLHYEPASRNWDISFSLLLPPSAADAAAVCLASVWKYIELATVHEDTEGARIAAFSFAAAPPLQPSRGEPGHGRLRDANLQRPHPR